MKNSLKLSLIRWYHVSDKPLPPWLQRACERDPQLAAEAQAETALTLQFRHDPRPPVREASSFLGARVARSLKTPIARADSPWRVGFRMAVLAGALCVGVLFSRWMAPSHAPVGTSAVGQTTLVSTQPGTERTTMVVRTPLAVGTPGKPAWVNPLDREVEHVIADAKGAVRFLAASFLPSAAMEKKSG